MKQGHGVLSVVNREATVRETANSEQVNSVPLRNSEQQRGHAGRSVANNRAATVVGL